MPVKSQRLYIHEDTHEQWWNNLFKRGTKQHVFLELFIFKEKLLSVYIYFY